jgi:hypothetical protein
MVCLVRARLGVLPDEQPCLGESGELRRETAHYDAGRRPYVTPVTLNKGLLETFDR